jgi:hypothetical protein
VARTPANMPAARNSVIDLTMVPNLPLRTVAAGIQLRSRVGQLAPKPPSKHRIVTLCRFLYVVISERNDRCAAPGLARRDSHEKTSLADRTGRWQGGCGCHELASAVPDARLDLFDCSPAPDLANTRSTIWRNERAAQQSSRCKSQKNELSVRDGNRYTRSTLWATVG